jgi:hypothetical protein
MATLTREQAENRLAIMMIELANLHEITQAGTVSWRGIRRQKHLVANLKRSWLPEIRIFIPDADGQIAEYLGSP